MANLITPHCDAETLAQALIDLKFKTVTLGDLTLDELKFIVCEYRKLLGEGVYAVFYFVGHGFEGASERLFVYQLPACALACIVAVATGRQMLFIKRRARAN